MNTSYDVIKLSVRAWAIKYKLEIYFILCSVCSSILLENNVSLLPPPGYFISVQMIFNWQQGLKK